MQFVLDENSSVINLHVQIDACARQHDLIAFLFSICSSKQITIAIGQNNNITIFISFHDGALSLTRFSIDFQHKFDFFHFSLSMCLGECVHVCGKYRFGGEHNDCSFTNAAYVINDRRCERSHVQSLHSKMFWSHFSLS